MTWNKVENSCVRSEELERCLWLLSTASIIPACLPTVVLTVVKTERAASLGDALISMKQTGSPLHPPVTFTQIIQEKGPPFVICLYNCKFMQLTYYVSQGVPV